ncbi:hypothetical protein V6N13_114091 [Hibiscus sabdariffa]|uniref:RNase H type-1 domain-containing protein n=1 Tax=Hibiscus sabdariffa TaxID=183260 RepID=A0ABR2U166_9ROSI
MCFQLLTLSSQPSLSSNNDYNANYVRHYIHEIDATTNSRVIFQRNSQDRWNPPPAGYVKVNFDAGYNAINKSSTLGVIFRDPEGLLLAACTCRIFHIPSPKIAESRACEQAVALASDLGFQKIIVEGDAWSVIKKARDSSFDMSDTFGLIRNIKRKSRDFEVVKFTNICRQ